MSEREIQKILFWFGGLFALIAVGLIFLKNPGFAICVLGFSVLLIGVGSVAPSTIKTLGAKWSASGGQIGFDRYQPTKKERELVEKMALNKPSVDLGEEGQKLIEAAENRTPEIRSAEDYLALGGDKWRAKEYDAALEDVFFGLALKPENTRIKATLVNLKAFIFEDLGSIELAEELYKEALPLDPKFPIPHYNLGVFYDKQGKQDEAEAEYKKAIELDSEYAPAHFGLGLLFKKQGKQDEAEAEYKEALELDSKYAGSHNNLGNLYQKQGKQEEAEAEYKKAIELDSEYADPHNNLGNLYQRQGKKEEAEMEYKKSLELDLKYADAHFNLGLLYEDQEKLELAKREFEQVLNINPDYGKAKIGLERVNKKMKE
jgi:tetratricopeptide (TPR) repeat protein